MKPTSPTPGLDSYVLHKQIPKNYPNLFTEASWMWAVANRKHNGLGRAFRKIGRNLFVIESILAECVNESVA